ncbi:fatty acid hydroxylase superfamily protein [Beauveria bassiana ARSEF 2860]|uniref:Fatty acid hydroxylase superfamily protein n=1 Tax=Beauveria bassiana (strain ARSEF 2860) TaxID=655819 RepID=J5JRA9_BEAB2|nr:fatty acid hydroxylase superfamily protein [Beauveria bassiana ARSEF 2860]EJP67528.1 fatty acid hydroxylase superfamily protein [Beauveria bassiana ARSEF 2860]
MSTQVNPKDSMKSTWLHGDRSRWKWSHKLLAGQLTAHPEYDIDIPVHAKTDPMPVLASWTSHVFVLLRALGTMLAHQVLLRVTGWRALPAWLVFGLYTAGALSMMGRLTTALRRLGKEHGFLDGEHARDGVPDVGVDRVAVSLGKLMLGRPGLTVLLAYRGGGADDAVAVAPLDVAADPAWWAWLAVHAGVYTLALDFFFYWYHRAMHDVPALWKLHRRHHLTKHPNTMLTGYADDEQELGDMLLIPLLTYLAMRAAFGDRFDFYHWWVCQMYVLFTESAGHSGVRLLLNPPSTLDWLWDRSGLALAVEDHDMHHRRGSKKSFNYGKQTLVWDHLFGTVYPREETPHVDRTKVVWFPMI